jgi:uncharacterized membrane protein
MFWLTVEEKDFARQTMLVAVVVGSTVVSPVSAAAVKVIVSVTSFASSGRAMNVYLYGVIVAMYS